VSFRDKVGDANLIFELVYTSVLAPASDVRCVADIVRRSRSYNLANGISGVLVFDGERFCQHLEGEQEAVLLLAAKIAGDSRHQQFRVLHQGSIGQQRRFGEWSLAYALDTEGTLLEVLAREPGLRAATLLQESLPLLENQPPSI
jgi:hypothetical protein